MNKSDSSETTLNPLDKHVVLNINRLLNVNIDSTLDYHKFLINFVNEAVKDNCSVCFLIEIDETNDKLYLNENDINIFHSFKNINNKSKLLELEMIKKIKAKFLFDDTFSNLEKCFFFFRNTKESFPYFVKKDLFTNYFETKNTIFIFDDPQNAENLFFDNYFTVFLSSLDINVDNWDYRSAKKICQCLIGDEILNWDYDRVNYEFISFLEQKND